MTSRGWIGVDLDGTLAEYESVPEAQWDPMRIGKPIPLMMERVRRWLQAGQEVRILTARVSTLDSYGRPIPPSHPQQCATAIQAWLIEQGLPPLKVQAHKDYDMLVLWDDRAVGVVKNTGVRCDGLPD